MLYPNIPSQITGTYEDIVSMTCANTEELANETFERLQERFFRVNEWHTLSDKVKTKFALIDSETHLPTSELKIDNYIRLDVPGPGSPSGEGYDWTKIIDKQNGTEDIGSPYVAFTVMPCSAPESTTENAAHFYTKTSSNTFIIRKIGTCIYAEVHGRNIEENTVDVPLLDTIRNKAVAFGGKIGLGSVHWLAITEALVSFDDN